MPISQGCSMTDNRNRWRILLLSAFGLLFFAVSGVCLGANPISFSNMMRVLAHGMTDDPVYRIVMYVRLPRVLGAILAGSGLAVSGVMIQAVLNNPLASPNIIGVNAGAGALVLLTSAFLPAYRFLLPLSAFAGALFAALLVLMIALGSGLSQLTLVLTGFAISSLFAAGMNTILILYPDAYIGAGNFLVGGLSALTMDDLTYPCLYIAVGLILAVLSAGELNLLSLGSDMARSLGMNVPLCRVLFLSVAALLAGAAVSFAGLIGFVGLVIPHAVKFLIGSDYRFVVPISAFLGAIFVLVCDLLARALFAPYELPVGILMAYIGGPFFVWLIFKNRRESYA